MRTPFLFLLHVMSNLTRHLRSQIVSFAGIRFGLAFVLAWCAPVIALSATFQQGASSENSRSTDARPPRNASTKLYPPVEQNSVRRPGNRVWAANPDPVNRQAGNRLAQAGEEQPLEEPQLASEVTIPFQSTTLPENSVLLVDRNLITLVVRDGSLSAVLNAIAEEMDLNVVSSADVNGSISITLNKVPLEDVLDTILSLHGYRWVRERDIIMVSKVSKESVLSPRVQGRKLRVFRLSYTSATDIDQTVTGLLSPVGRSYVTEIDSVDKRKTREELVVEDFPEYLDRVEAYIRQADRPPAQVLIEAYVLQVNLRDSNRHGVEIENIVSLVGGDLTLTANGIANPDASPAFIINLDGRRLDALVEMIKETTDAKTLASPKVLAVNGQEARIQIGESLGYLTTTTTQTSTLQQVNFLDLGVVLTATPVISSDGQILMTVKPEVSSGSINPTTGLPDSDTTEVESTVLMPSGHAMVIGGLITEEDNDQQAKVPWLGDVPGLGKLFQRRTHLKTRSEIIIALLPRIVPYGPLADHKTAGEVQRATSPVVYGPLIPANRTRLEATLPNANRVCDPFGRPMESFPTPPVAYSPFSPSGMHQPYLPPASEEMPQLVPPSYYQPSAPEIPAPGNRAPGNRAPGIPAPLPGDDGEVQQTSGRMEKASPGKGGSRTDAVKRTFRGWRSRLFGK